MLHKQGPATGPCLWKHVCARGACLSSLASESGIHLFPEGRIGQVKAQLFHEAQALFPCQRGPVVPDGELHPCGAVSGQDKAVVQENKGYGQRGLVLLEPAKEDQHELAVVAAVLIEELEFYESPGRIGTALFQEFGETQEALI